LKFRAFVSVDIEPDQTLVSLLEALRRSGGDLKVVRSENLHVTLKFLGDTDQSLVEEIVERLTVAVADTQPFSLSLRGMGAFPSLTNIKVVWVGMDDGAVLGGIAERLEDSFSEMGFRRERRGFRPHLTVARARTARGMSPVADMITANAATDFGGQQVERVVLKKSVLTPKGPVYSDVEKVPLGSR
jgi:2'-5' RNA ligase